LAHRRPPTRLYLHDGATPNCWLGLYMLRPPPMLPIPLEPTFACHATATASAGVSHSRDAYSPHTGVLHSRDAMPLALEFHVSMLVRRYSPHAGVLHSPCLSRWSSTLARCLASERTMATVCFRATYSISYEDSGHYPRPAFERRGVSAMRPSFVTADGGHVLLSSNVLPRPCDRFALPPTVATSHFRARWYISYETVARYCRRWLRPAFQITRHPHLAFLATLGISYGTVVLYRRRWLRPAF